MAEDKARHLALRTIEEKRILELEEERKKLVVEVNKQDELISQCLLKIEEWEARDRASRYGGWRFRDR